MPTPSPRRAALRGAALSLLFLPPSLAAAFATVGAVGRLVPGLPARVGPPMFFSIVMLCATIGGGLWGWALARGTVPAPAVRRLVLGAAAGYGLAAPVAIWTLTAAETTLLVRAQEGMLVPMHVAFGAIFPFATFLVVLGTVLGVARALPGHAGGLRLALRCALSAAAAFFLVTVAMDLTGWRVGGPDAEARFTMLVVMGLGLVAATAVAGAVLGRALGQASVAPVEPILPAPALRG